MEDWVFIRDTIIGWMLVVGGILFSGFLTLLASAALIVTSWMSGKFTRPAALVFNSMTSPVFSIVKLFCDAVC